MPGTDRLSCFIASLAAQIRAAIHVGLPLEDTEAEIRGADERFPARSRSDALQWDDAPGRMTRNGLGSLDIGAGKTRVDE